LSVHCGAENLTHGGGVYRLHRFLTRIGFKRAVATDLRMIQRNNRDRVGEMLLALLYPIILGLERIETTQLLRQHGVFPYRTGLPRYPEATPLRRFLLRVAPAALPKLRALPDRLLARLTLWPRRPTRLVFDLDSTGLVVYGTPEQARNGYTPQKRGRPSYHPRLCVAGQTPACWHGELRPGDTQTASGTLTLLPACFAQGPAGIRMVSVRADKGFSDHTCVEWLEAQGARFVSVARLTGPIQRQLAPLRYPSPSPGVEVAEFPSQPPRWPHPYRFVVIRRPPPEEPTAQLTLCKLGKSPYQVRVTHLALQPLNLWRFYNDRAGVELLIKHLKGEYALGNIPTRHFLATETYFHLRRLAYHLVNWFQRLCLPAEYQTATRQTLRPKILRMPAQFQRVGNRPRLTLPASGAREAAWEHALNQINRPSWGATALSRRIEV
jgi:hypothetical protein